MAIQPSEKNPSPKFATTRSRPPQQDQKSLQSQFGPKCDIKKVGNTYGVLALGGAAQRRCGSDGLQVRPNGELFRRRFSVGT